MTFTHAGMAEVCDFAATAADEAGYRESARKLRAAAATLRAMDWRPIDDAAKHGSYVLIGDGPVLPDIAAWCAERPQFVGTDGNRYLARPAGWFTAAKDRSRIRHPTRWMPLPQGPKP